MTHSVNTRSTEFRPFLTLRFLSLLVKTVQLKRRYRHLAEANYAGYLQQYYRRANNPYWERVVEDKWQAARPLAVQMAGLQPGERVLDLATGAGFQAAAFAGEGHQAIGLDIVYDRLQVASRRHPTPCISWVVADAAHIPLPTDACEVVTISLALHDMPLTAIRKVLQEARRVASRRVVIIEPRLPRRNLLRQFYITLSVLFDESFFIQEYLECDVMSLFQEAALELVDAQTCCHQVLAIYVCDFP